MSLIQKHEFSKLRNRMSLISVSHLEEKRRKKVKSFKYKKRSVTAKKRK